MPVACLNRDDLNSPKTAVFGGVQRHASSQSWKRAIRELAAEQRPWPFGAFQGQAESSFCGGYFFVID
ncbi:MAG: type I-E CRISPR-associated protein Cas7/Cse4/CasC [Nitrospirales bacterium]|nr:type I-E CRISPR-associated protein Cas7/Cse4/CasC [Nitrospirales bacterium]